jgi:DNA-directed RNA polymerase specialized sigma24 family protein
VSADARESAEIARLRAAILVMPEPRRSVYVLCARDGLDYSAVAGRLGLAVGEVQRLLAEALVDLITAADDAGEPAPSLQ